jgi:hypothetical protein
MYGIVCLYVCVCAFSLHRESPNMILGEKPLISEVVLSDPTIAHMILVHERTALSLDALVTAHVLIMVIVFRVGLVFPLEAPSLTLNRDIWTVHAFPVVVHVPLGQVTRCKGLWKPLLVAWLSAEFLRFISLTPTLNHQHFLILCRWWTEVWWTRGSWILVAHDTWPEIRNDSPASLPCHIRSMWLLGMTRRVRCLGPVSSR